MSKLEIFGLILIFFGSASMNLGTGILAIGLGSLLCITGREKKNVNK